MVFFQVSRPWKPARRCGSCLYPNDDDANFCQACGVATAPVKPLVQQGRGAVDEKAIQERFHCFKSSVGRKPYRRQKSALEQQFSTFLASVFPPKTISSCTADDVIRFLIHKDKSGRTVVHASDCSKLPCKCPRRLAAGTVDSLLGKLRSILNGLGRLDLANPVAHPRVREYLKFVREEQAGLAVSPSQAVPLFFVKFRKLVALLREKIANSRSLSRIHKYVLVRDAVFFVVDFFTGDRASDLGRLLANQVFKLKDREGYLFRFTLTKTLRKGPPRSFALIPFGESEVCPVNWITYYLSVCDLLDVRLPGGFFFRASDRNKDVGSRPFVGSAVNNRLRGYLVEAKIFDGETPHSFRVGLSNTLRLLGCSQQEVAQYIGWQSGEMAEHYSRMSDTAASLAILEGILPGAVNLVGTPVSHPENLQAICNI